MSLAPLSHSAYIYYIYTIYTTIYTKKAQSTDRGPQPSPRAHTLGSPDIWAARAHRVTNLEVPVVHTVQGLEERAWGWHVLVQGCLHPEVRRQQSEAQLQEVTARNAAPSKQQGSALPRRCCCRPLLSLGPGLTPGTCGPLTNDPTGLIYTKTWVLLR